MPSPDLSIVIRCFNEAKHIGKLLTGIGEQTLPAEVIVVDSGSTDASVEIARAHGARIVAIPPAEFSFGRALNRGCAAANGEILVFVSAHCYPIHDDWLERLVAPFSDERVACAYGLQRGHGTTRFSEHRIFEQWFPETPDPDQQTPFCNNANCAVRRSVWLEQPYDEALTGLEDIAWAHRAQQAGHRVVYEPAAGIHHIHEEGPRRIFNRYRREAIALKAIFPQEHFGFGDFLRLWVTSLRGDARAARDRGRLVRTFPEILMFRTMQYLGALRGFQQHGPVPSELKRRFYYARSPAAGSAHESPRSEGRRIEYAGIEEPRR